MEPEATTPPSKKIIRKSFFVAALIFILACFFAYYFFIGSFHSFDDGKIVYVKKGMALKTIAEEFKAEGIVSSEDLLMTTIVALGGENKVVAGPYFFSRSEGIFPLSLRLTSGDFQIKPLKITFPEGFTVKQFSARLKEKISVFDSNAFLALAAPKEGYLFPETYFFLPDITATDTLAVFTDTFDEKISGLKNEILSSGKTLSDIVTMASVLEGEVQTLTDKKIVAGILWKRISIGMALQVDATLAYERGKTSAELSTDDLRTNSPYNTYTNKGLPPTPIGNPGLDSLVAAIEPTESKYLYFLTDKDGAVHYAKTFEEHKANKAKYL